MRALFIALAATCSLTLAPLGASAFDEGPNRPSAPEAWPDSLPTPGKQGRETPAPDKPADKTDAAKPGGPSLTDVKPEPDHRKRLDALFAALKAAPTKDSAKDIADRIEIAMLPSDSETADLLMSRAAAATEAKDFDLAISLLDGVLAVVPDHLEAWNKRATVFYLKQDFSDSLADLQQVVAREPRHYAAWAGIALICKEIGDEKHALDAARQALAVYPQLEAMKDMEKELSISVEGRPI